MLNNQLVTAAPILKQFFQPPAYSAFLGPISAPILLIYGSASPYGRTYPAVRCKYRFASIRLANPNRLHSFGVFFSSPVQSSLRSEPFDD